MNLEKSESIKVQFDEICKHISIHVPDPKKSGSEYYVGLQHLDCEDIHLKRHGVPEDVSKTKLRFKKGHILFGKRNWYLRRLAIAPFDGICSAHMIVLEPIEGKIIKEFLPLLMLSDIFYEKALMISEGSMSPTIKWKSLANLEFVLPSIETQKSIVYLISIIDENIFYSEKIEKEIIHLKKSLQHKLLHKGLKHKKFQKVRMGLWYMEEEYPESWKILKLGDVCSVERGKFTHRPRGDPAYYGGKYPFIQTSDVENSNGYITKYSQTLNDAGLSVSKIFPPDTVIITIAANIGSTSITTFPVCFPDSIVAISSPKMDPVFLRNFLELRKPFLNTIATESAQKNLNLETMKNLSIPVPDIAEQKQIAEIFSKIDKQLEITKQQKIILKTLKKSSLHSMMKLKPMGAKKIVQ